MKLHEFAYVAALVSGMAQKLSRAPTPGLMGDKRR